MPFDALLDNYLAVFLATIVGFGLIATALIAARLLAPFSKEENKRTSYEWGTFEGDDPITFGDTDD